MEASHQLMSRLEIKDMRKRHATELEQLQCSLLISGADFWQNRGFNDKSVKTSKIVHLDLLNKIGYGPIA